MAVALLEPRDFVRDPDALAATPTLSEALEYTRWLATHHYENFHVVSFLLPRHLHQDFYNVYAYCRWADDLGDEMGDTAESLRLLAWWREELHQMYTGVVHNPVFVALHGTVERHSLPQEPFDRLITAFERDQTVARYANWDEVFDYCVYSANPVGRLVLGLGGYRDAERQRLSDETCTGLQLANFWQDVTVDWRKNRVYLPLDLLARHGVGVEDIAARRFTPGFADAMREAVTVARGFFDRGQELPSLVDRRLALDLELFTRGGVFVLDKIAAAGYDVLRARPHVSKVERAGILFRGILRWAARSIA